MAKVMSVVCNSQEESDRVKEYDIQEKKHIKVSVSDAIPINSGSGNEEGIVNYMSTIMEYEFAEDSIA
ncbi:hypothetical protein HOLleu_03355 [Holothuria leucospilota]|uniref:Uncharacterized protein n=1 Tax=Holothuria leucospilota TaxID=206669 RepID=A0A9Q1HLV3_HOLLE|nr:hypothetical protein HOLleu_03355 [Holothuria leucospilota]